MEMIKQPTIPPMPKQPTFDARDTQYNLPIGTDLISRAAAQTELQLSARRYTVAHEAHGEGRVVWSEDLISVSDAMDVLRKIPSAQPKMGKWIDRGEHGDWEWQADGRGKHWHEWECNTCHHYFDERTFFCPHCGADMREVTS